MGLYVDCGLEQRRWDIGGIVKLIEDCTVGLDGNYSNWGVGALLDYEKSLFSGVPNTFTVDPYVTLPFLFGSGIQVYTTIALTRLSPNHEVGVRLVF